MDVIKLRHEKVMQALSTLDVAVKSYQQIISGNDLPPSPLNDVDKLARIYRDSMIKRFEYCTELFWKYIKKYLDEYVQGTELNGPAPVIRAACAAGLLEEQEAESALMIIKDRNLTSHIYKEEIAEVLAKKIPHHAALMASIIERLTPQ